MQFWGIIPHKSSMIGYRMTIYIHPSTVPMSIAADIPSLLIL